MTYVIAAILIVSLLLIATERKTGINKAAVSVFACTLGWVLYVGFGADFIDSMYAEAYSAYLNGTPHTSTTAKYFIAQHILLPHIGRAAEIALFLLATMSIVNILYANGCFDFLKMWIRTRNSRLLLWKLSALAFFMSANIDNVSAIVIMLTLTNAVVIHTKDRWTYSAAVMLAVNFGGILTVIGDPTSLSLWNKGAITASSYTLSMLAPCILGWAIPTLLIAYKLPTTVEIESSTMPYRGQDTSRSVWQRAILFLVGIGGLWFIPTFSDITKLPPFLGALCVLSLLWITNEVSNRGDYGAERMRRADVPQKMQYNAIQQILYTIGVILALGVVSETGAVEWASNQLSVLVGNGWGIGVLAGIISCPLESFASCMTFISLHDVVPTEMAFSTNAPYWRYVALGTTIGGSILAIGSISGVVMMQMQRMPVGWYVRHMAPKVLLAGAIAYGVLCATIML